MPREVWASLPVPKGTTTHQAGSYYHLWTWKGKGKQWILQFRRNWTCWERACQQKLRPWGKNIDPAKPQLSREGAGRINPSTSFSSQDLTLAEPNLNQRAKDPGWCSPRQPPSTRSGEAKRGIDLEDKWKLTSTPGDMFLEVQTSVWVCVWVCACVYVWESGWWEKDCTQIWV